MDIAAQRVAYALSHYGGHPGIDFVVGDIRKDITHMGFFDFILIRFVLEYYRSSAFEIVCNVAERLNPGGTLCLIDLDHNCMNHYGISLRLEKALTGVMGELEETADFDCFAGRKLYAHLFDLGFNDIHVHMEPHHLIYGPLNEVDEFNWNKKVEVAARSSGFPFEDLYTDGFAGFFNEFRRTFADPRRFTYTPLIMCWGRRA